MSSPASDADELVLHNANVITLDPRRPRAGVVVAKGGRIHSVGQSIDLSSIKGGNVTVVDCKGKTVVPGFIDPHTHFLAYAASLVSADCSPESVTSLGGIQGAIARRAGQTPAGSWIKGTGYNESYLREGRHPNRWDLDRATETHPVKLIHRSGHACVLNSYALKLAGITTETPEPEGGVIERAPETGEPTGLFLDLDGWLDERLDSPSWQGGMEEAIRMASEQYLSMGITSFQDASPSNSFEQWRLFHRLKEEGILAPRASMMVGYRYLQEIKATGLEFGSGDDDSRIGHAKVFLTSTTGALYPSEVEFKEMVRTAAAGGFPVAIHAVEEVEVEAAISALEGLAGLYPSSGLRHRIEHCSVCPPDLWERLRRLNVVVVTQPGFVYYNGERYLQQVPREQIPWLYPIRSLRGKGIRVAGSSDCPVAPPSPITAIYAAMTRRTSNGEAVGLSEKISALEALRLYTVDGAYAFCEEGVKGTISPGKLGDLAILSDDITRVDAEAIKEIEVWGTVLRGKLAWQRGQMAG